MNLTISSNPNFKGNYYNTHNLRGIQRRFYRAPEPTIEATNEYFLDMDRTFKSLPDNNAWNCIYSLDMDKRKDFANLMRLSFKTRDEFTNSYGKTRFPFSDLELAHDFQEGLDELLKTDGILTEKEIKRFNYYTAGAYTYLELLTSKSKLPEIKEAASENLKFIKVLLSKGNRKLLENTNPRTLVGILFNEKPDYDEYIEGLKNLKRDIRKFSIKDEDQYRAINLYLLKRNIDYSDPVETFSNQHKYFNL